MCVSGIKARCWGEPSFVYVLVNTLYLTSNMAVFGSWHLMRVASWEGREDEGQGHKFLY